MVEDKNFNPLVRILNADLRGEKQAYVALKKIKGVGRIFANAALQVAGVERTKKVGYLTDQEIQRIEEVINNPLKHNFPSWMLNRRKDLETGADMHIIGPDLKFTKENDIKSMQRVKSYKGLRHSWGLTVRGQRTQGNFRKNKGKGSIKKKVSVIRK